MPIGDSAKYKSATIRPFGTVFFDENIIIQTPTEALVPIYTTTADWTGIDRCNAINNNILDQAPIPLSFITDPDTFDFGTPNMSASILMPDKKTFKQNQPFNVCTSGKAATGYRFNIDSINGDGIYGAHGGSGLSSLGGTIRIGELVHGGVIRHALQLGIYCYQNCYYDIVNHKGFRWPADRNDGYAADIANSLHYGGTNQYVQQGSLLALNPTFNLDSLNTEPAKIIAQALKDYGAYIVDDAAWSAVNFSLEWSPNGRVLVEFNKNWGYNFKQSTINTTGQAGLWTADILKIVTNLYAITNNGPLTIGGGGTPRQPLAAPLASEAVQQVPNQYRPKPILSLHGDFFNIQGKKLIGRSFKSLPVGLYLTSQSKLLLNTR
jgi:hypothetical protein